MATLVQSSRFAGLKIEDDDYPPSQNDQKSKKNKNNSPKPVIKTEPVKKPKNNNNKPAQQSNGNQTKKKTKKPAPTAQQWEQWKQKDEELVDGNFECELQQAILLSKLDFEEKKDVYKQSKKEAEIERKMLEQVAKAGTKKQKKKNVMSLEQFNDMVSANDEPKQTEEEKDPNNSVEEPEAAADTEFFDRVRDEAKIELRKDKHIDRIKQRKPVSDEVITRVQFAEALERKDKEIAQLRNEVTSLKEELLTVKSRNKKLCNILGQGEMRDKAQVLVEVERLLQVQAELTAEVASLHTRLEQERSRHPDLRTKDKRKKSTSNDKEK